MINRTVTAVLEAPKDDVFAYLARVENLPEWATDFARELKYEDGKAKVVNGLGEFFFRIEADDLVRPGIYGPPVQYLGIFEDNDPTKRLMVVANYNNDVGDAWQWSDQGLYPIDITNDAYKLGVNYVMYALTH